MSLLNIPNELLLLIAKHLSPQELSSLVCTNRHLSIVLTPLLHEFALEDKDGLPALEWAAIEGYEALVSVILELKRADGGGGQGGELSWTKGALHQASAYGHESIVRRLLAGGVPGIDVHCRLDGLTALHYSARYGKAGAMRALLEAGADANARDGRSRDTGLHFAVHGYEGIAGGRKMEDERGIWRTFTGSGASFGSVRRGFYGSLEVLLEFGADVGMEDSCGRTPLDIARKYRLKDVVGLFEVRLKPNLLISS